MAGLTIRRAQKLFGDDGGCPRLPLDVGDGEFVTLLGPLRPPARPRSCHLSQDWKTPSSGEIALDGRAIHDLAPSQRNIAMVFQSYALYPHKTVAENIAFPLLMQAALPLRISRVAPLRPRPPRA